MGMKINRKTAKLIVHKAPTPYFSEGKDYDSSDKKEILRIVAIWDT